MKIGRCIKRFGLAVCMLFASGCGGVNLDFAQRPNSESDPTTQEPLAVIAIAPSQQWFGEIQALTKNGDSTATLSKERIQKKLPGLNIEQSAAVFLYLTDEGSVAPVIYIPVVDYERFLNKLSCLVNLHRAVASQFNVGSQQFLVKQVGDFAVVGTSLKRMNYSPRSPKAYLAKMPDHFDFTLKVFAQSLTKKEKQKLASTLHNILGDAFEKVVYDAESIVVGTTVDSEAGFVCQAAINPIPNDVEDAQQLLKKFVESWGLKAATAINGESLVCDFDVDSQQVISKWSNIQSALMGGFNARESVFAQHQSMYAGGNESGSIPAGAFSSGGGISGGGGCRRSGGG